MQPSGDDALQKEVVIMNEANAELAKTLSRERENHHQAVLRGEREVKTIRQRAAAAKIECTVEVERSGRDCITQTEAVERKSMRVEMIMWKKVLATSSHVNAAMSTAAVTRQLDEITGKNAVLQSQLNLSDVKISKLETDLNEATTLLTELTVENTTLRETSSSSSSHPQQQSEHGIKAKLRRLEETHAAELYKASERAAKLMDEIQKMTSDAILKITYEEGDGRGGVEVAEARQRCEAMRCCQVEHRQIYESVLGKVFSAVETQHLAERVLQEQRERETAVVILQKEAEGTLDQLEAVLGKKEAALRQISELLKVQSDLQDKLAESESLVSILRKDKDTLKKRLSGSTEKLTETKKQASELKTQLSLVIPYDDRALSANIRRDTKELQNEIGILKRQLKDVSETGSKNEAAAGKQKIEASKRQVEVEATKERLRESQKQLATLKKLNTTLKTDLDKKTEMLDSLTKQRRDLVPVQKAVVPVTPPPQPPGGSRVEYLKILLTDKETMLCKFREETHELTAKITVQDNELALLRRQNEILRDDVAKSAPEVERLKVLLDAAVRSRDDAENASNLQREEAEDAWRERQGQLGDMEKMEFRITELSGEVEKHSFECEKLGRKYQEAAGDNTELRGQLSSLKKELSESYQRTSSAALEISSIVTERTTEKERYGRLVSDLQNQTDSVQKQLSTLTDENLTLKTTLTHQQKQIVTQQQQQQQVNIPTYPYPKEQLEEAYQKGYSDGRTVPVPTPEPEVRIVEKIVEKIVAEPCVTCDEMGKKFAMLQTQYKAVSKERRTVEKRCQEAERDLSQEVDTLRIALKQERSTHVKEVTELRANAERLHARSESRLTKIKTLQVQLREFRNLPEPEQIVTEHSDPGTGGRSRQGRCSGCGRVF